MKWKSSQINSLKLFFIIIGSLLFQTLTAQKTVKVYGIKGVSFVTDNITLKQARQEALNDAKMNALKAAGVIENINSYEAFVSSANNSDYSQYYSSGILSELQGAILDFNSCKPNKDTLFKSEQFEHLIVNTFIDASIIVYDTRPDESFNVKLDGLKSVYNNKDKLTFSILSTQDCYLTIFTSMEENASVLFPNKYENSFLIQKNKQINFPIGQSEYELTTEKKNGEKNKIIFVFTKKPNSYIKVDNNQETKIDDVFSWISAITPDQKRVEYKTFIIQ